MSNHSADDFDPTDAAIEEYLRLLDGGGEVDRAAFIAAHPEAAEALRSFFGSVSLLQQLAGTGGLGVGHTSGAMTQPPREPNLSAEDVTDSRLPWTSLPAMFGRYRVESLLGRGAMGAVYRAHDTQLDRSVALKLSHLPENTVLELRERLLQEARAAASLSHPNICRVHDVGEIGGTRFIAMELIEGRPLSDYIRTSRLPPPKTAVTLIRKLALALQAAHDKGIVHRDLKPTNVIVNADHEPILMDFGLAQRPVAVGEERLTKEGMLIGSPAYMSPEQARADGTTIGPASDIYSLGVVFYELLTGQLPFTGSVMTILAKVLSEEPPSLQSVRPEIDRDLSDICRKMLAKRPEERFASMDEVAEALQRWLKSAAKSSREMAAKLEAPPSPAPLRKLTPGQVESLTLSARRCVKHHDYAQATKLLESIPYSQHSDESRSLLRKAQELRDEVELLIADMDQAVSLKQLETLPATLNRLLKLKPGYLPAKQLLDGINSYGSGERRSFYYSPIGDLLPGNKEEGLFHGVGRMMALSLAFGTLVFAGTSWYVWNYLLDPLRTVQVEIDDPTATVIIDDQTVALSDGKGEVRLRTGNHGWTALKEGLALKSAKFTVGKDHAGTLVIRLSEDEPIPVAARNNDPTTNSPPQGDPPRIELVSELNSDADEQSLWVSPTGLRIYFERDAQIWHASRKSKAEKFGAAMHLFSGRHPTLSADETEIYFVVPEQLAELQSKTRVAIDTPFGAAYALMTLVQYPNVKCPSLTEDGLSLVFTSRTNAGVHRIMVTERRTRLSEWGPAKPIKLVDLVTPDKLRWPRLVDGGRAVLCNDESDSGGHRFVTFVMRASDSFGMPSYLNDPNRSTTDLSKLAGRSPSYCAATDELYFTSTRSQRFQRNADGKITGDWEVFRLKGASRALAPELARLIVGVQTMAAAPLVNDWTPLFNGRDLTGWTPVQFTTPDFSGIVVKQGGWEVRNGAIVCTSSARGMLQTHADYGDFELELEYRLPPKADSGIIFRHDGRGPLLEHSLEVQLIDDVLAANLVDRTGALLGVVGPSQPAATSVGVWNRVRLVCRGNDVFIDVNGQLTATALGSNHPKLQRRPRTGRIALNNATGEANGSEYRNIRLRRLDPAFGSVASSSQSTADNSPKISSTPSIQSAAKPNPARPKTDLSNAPRKVPLDYSTKQLLRQYTGDPKFVPVYFIDNPKTLESWLTTEYWPLDMRANVRQGQWESCRFQLLGYAYAKPHTDARQLFVHVHLGEWRFMCMFDEKPSVRDFVRKDEWYPFNGHVLTKERPGTTAYLRVVHKQNKKQLFWSREAWSKRTADVNQYWIDRGYAFSLLKEPK